MGALSLINRSLRRRILAGELPLWVRMHPRRRYIVQCALAAPPWIDKRAIARLHAEAKRRTALTGVPHVVDHVIPLTHPYVCGLTVPGNLRVVPYVVNAAKLNAWCEDQLEMFVGPEQFRLPGIPA